MARRKKQEAAVADGLDGTVEGLAREHFEREKAGYEERTGETVWFEPGVPVTRTPIGSPESGVGSPESGAEPTEKEAIPAESEPEGDGDN